MKRSSDKDLIDLVYIEEFNKMHRTAETSRNALVHFMTVPNQLIAELEQVFCLPAAPVDKKLFNLLYNYNDHRATGNYNNRCRPEHEVLHLVFKFILERFSVNIGDPIALGHSLASLRRFSNKPGVQISMETEVLEAYRLFAVILKWIRADYLDVWIKENATKVFHMNTFHTLRRKHGGHSISVNVSPYKF